MQYVPAWEVEEVWQRASPLLALAVERQTAFNLEGLKAMLLRGEMHLWLNESAAMVTQIQTFQLERICVIVLCGGSGLETWAEKIRGTILKYAKSFGCAAVMVYGRSGWSRVFPELRVTDTVMRYKL